MSVLIPRCRLLSLGVLQVSRLPVFTKWSAEGACVYTELLTECPTCAPHARMRFRLVFISVQALSMAALFGAYYVAEVRVSRSQPFYKFYEGIYSAANFFLPPRVRKRPNPG